MPKVIFSILLYAATSLGWVLWVATDPKGGFENWGDYGNDEVGCLGAAQFQRQEYGDRAQCIWN